MKLLFTVACALLHASADADVKLGPFATYVGIGNISKKYEPMTVDDIKATDRAVAALEYLRRFMVSGIDQMPPMDPYKRKTMEPVVFDQLHSKLKGIVHLSNLEVKGASKYTLKDLELRKDTMRVDFDISVPQVVANVDFSTVNFDYDNNILKLNASGHLQITLDNLHEVGALTVIKKKGTPPTEEFFEVQALHVDKYIDNIEVKESGMTGSLPDNMVTEIAHTAAISVAETSIKQMNEILRKLKAEQILAILMR